MYTKKFLLDSFSHHHYFFFIFFEKMELPLCGFAFGVVGFFLVGSIQINLGLCLCLSWVFFF